MSIKKSNEAIVPIYGSRSMQEVVPKYEIPKTEMPSRTAYDLVHDQLMLDGNARLNLATSPPGWSLKHSSS